jgi:hypothetical protein
MGGTYSAYGRIREVLIGFWFENLWERDHLEDPDVDGRIILRWILKPWDVGVWTGSSWLKIGTGGGGNGFSGSVKCGAFLDWLKN